MSNTTVKRNGYIDIIKFLFAIIIAEFHLNSGIFIDGRLAVEGFFMISGFLMMKSVESSNDLEKTGISTVKFLFKKYKALLPMLLISAMIGFVVNCALNSFTFQASIENLPLLLFDIFPLHTTGIKGVYVLGISWYLSSMFIALAILFPFVKKFKSSFVLVACPLIAFLFYGILSAKYGNIAVGSTFIPNTLVHTGFLRSLAGCSMGCLIYEITKRMKSKEFTKFARIVFTILEILALLFIFYMMHHYSKVKQEYVVIFVIFGMLIIGISGASYTSYLWNPKWTKYFGIASTLIVLNHYCWTRLLKVKLNYLDKWETALAYVGMVCTACIIVYFGSRLLCLLTGKLLQKKLWIKNCEEK